jgi:hypothetical protein
MGLTNMGLTDLQRLFVWARPLALVFALSLVTPLSWAESAPSMGALEVPQDPLLQRPQPIPESPVARTMPSQPLYSTMPAPTYLTPPPPLVPPAMIPDALLPPGVLPGSTLPVPMPSPRY